LLVLKGLNLWDFTMFLGCQRLFLCAWSCANFSVSHFLLKAASGQQLLCKITREKPLVPRVLRLCPLPEMEQNVLVSTGLHLCMIQKRSIVIIKIVRQNRRWRLAVLDIRYTVVFKGSKSWLGGNTFVAGGLKKPSFEIAA